MEPGFKSGDVEDANESMECEDPVSLKAGIGNIDFKFRRVNGEHCFGLLVVKFSCPLFPIPLAVVVIPLKLEE
jgi:hypothetical protein